MDIVPNRAYSGTACYHCYKSAVPLSKCSGCRRVRFCSVACSKVEWKDHKGFCRSFGTLRATMVNSQVQPTPFPSESKDISALRHAARANWLLEDSTLETALGREPTMLESRLLYREPRCAVCWRREDQCGTTEQGGDWSMCSGCQIVGYCSKEHAEMGKIEHSTKRGNDLRSQCEVYVLSSEIDEFYLRLSIASKNQTLSQVSTWTPLRILSAPAPLPASWTTFLTSSGLPSNPTPTNAEVYGVFVEALSVPLTVLQGSRRLGFGLDWNGETEEIVLHIIGATVEVEGSTGIQSWEEILHQLPAVKRLSIFFIGDEVPDDIETHSMEIGLECCPACKAKGRSRTVQWRKGLYHDVASTLPPPSLIVALNAGFSHLPILRSTWTPTLVSIINSDVPLLWTAQTSDEAMEDQERIDELVKDGREGDAGSRGFTVERNRWAGEWLRVDCWEKSGGWGNNVWFGGVAR